MGFHKALLRKVVLGEIKEKRLNSMYGLALSRKKTTAVYMDPKKDVPKSRTLELEMNMIL